MRARANALALASLGLLAAAGCSLLVGTETRTLLDGSLIDAAGDDAPPPDASDGASASPDASDATVSDGACGATCLSQAHVCAQACVTVYTTCVGNCNNTPCKNGCATSESACFGNCVSVCTGCTSGAGCTNQAACQAAAAP